MYAVEFGIKMAKDQAAKAFILQLMDDLQKVIYPYTILSIE